jgi:hypothetical protein
MTGAENGSAEPPSIDVTHYETLRRAALGEGLPPEARSGLTLFLRRGMWAWARAMATARVPQPPARSPASSWTASEGYEAVIHVFAAMVIHADNRGALP